MALKLITVLLFLYLSDVHCQSHDLIMGSIGFSDRLLATINHEKAAIPFTVRTSDIDYPYTGISQPNNISAIYVKDVFSNGKGGYATITSGGIGQRYVRLRFKSQRGGAMNFTVSLYGR